VALLLFLLTTFLGPLVVLSSWRYIQERVNLYCIALLLLETAMLGRWARSTWSFSTSSGKRC